MALSDYSVQQPEQDGEPEANLQIVRLSSACPPDAVRPHLQQGYLLGEYPEIADFGQNANYSHYEMDFGRRLIAKFRFDPATL